MCLVKKNGGQKQKKQRLMPGEKMEVFLEILCNHSDDVNSNLLSL